LQAARTNGEIPAAESGVAASDRLVRAATGIRVGGAARIAPHPRREWISAYARMT